MECEPVVPRSGSGTGVDIGTRFLIELNPPFHEGTATHKDLALELCADAARVLAPGGQLWTVWNSHLQYRRTSEIAPTSRTSPDHAHHPSPVVR